MNYVGLKTYKDNKKEYRHSIEDLTGFIDLLRSHVDISYHEILSGSTLLRLYFRIRKSENMNIMIKTLGNFIEATSGMKNTRYAYTVGNCCQVVFPDLKTTQSNIKCLANNFMKSNIGFKLDTTIYTNNYLMLCPYQKDIITKKRPMIEFGNIEDMIIQYTNNSLILNHDYSSCKITNVNSSKTEENTLLARIMIMNLEAPSKFYKEVLSHYKTHQTLLDYTIQYDILKIMIDELYDTYKCKQA